MDDKQPLLLSDLENPIVKKLFDRLVVNTIRRCFLVYSPVIIAVALCFGTMVYGVAGWGYTQIIDKLDLLTQHQKIQDVKINGIESDLYKIQLNIQSLKGE